MVVTRPFACLRPPAGWVARLPAPTVRLRLTLLYGGLFLASGAVLLAITYLLVRHATGNVVLFRAGGAHKTIALPPGSGGALGGIPAVAQEARAQAVHQHAAELHQLLVQSGIALAIMAVVSIALGWLVAGRVLRPLRQMTATARRISERNLNQRLAIDGPRDELRELADTVDGLLARLEGAFGAQKHFVANAAHELRTPLTLLRALLEETLTDPSANLDSFRTMSRRLLALGQEQERLLEALLTLASSERGLDHRQPFDLSVIAKQLLLAPTLDAGQLDLDIDAKISSAPTTGDPALAERLVANLIDNAIRYNTAGGRVQVATGTKADRAFVLVANTGPVVAPDQVERLFEPFQRHTPQRTSNEHGHHGLGLSIVRAIATAHHATITAKPGPNGGLAIHVNFPLAEADQGALPLSHTSRHPPQSGDDRQRGKEARAIWPLSPLLRHW
jgi:signal transduction histidine kinase